MTIGEEVVKFYENFGLQSTLPEGVEVHNPFDDPKKRSAIIEFCQKYYADSNGRTHILGINPSRMTATTTGVNYTDGYALKYYCGIDNEFSASRELTSDFFYRVVEKMGGADTFYKTTFAWAIMPLSVTKEGGYENYYEESLLMYLLDIILSNMAWLQTSIPSTGKAVVLGTGENKKSFGQLAGHPFGYDQVEYLPHPRWVMQYNRAKLDHYTDLYVKALT